MNQLLENKNPTVYDSGILRVRLELSYDGTIFSGWAKQPKRLTIQGVLETVLATILRTPINLVVAGRTDAGVHARRQIAHFDVPVYLWNKLSESNTTHCGAKLLSRMPGLIFKTIASYSQKKYLIHDHIIQIYSAEPISADFDARFSAIWRKYKYRIANTPESITPFNQQFVLYYWRELDIDLMNQAAQAILGEHDFFAFSKPRPETTTIRELQTFSWNVESEGLLVATVQANAFCHNMVRALVSAVMKIGIKIYPPSWLYERMEAKKRDSYGGLVAAKGLTLEEVGYPVERFWKERQNKIINSGSTASLVLDEKL